MYICEVKHLQGILLSILMAVATAFIILSAVRYYRHVEPVYIHDTSTVKVSVRLPLRAMHEFKPLFDSGKLDHEFGQKLGDGTWVTARARFGEYMTISYTLNK